MPFQLRSVLVTSLALFASLLLFTARFDAQGPQGAPPGDQRSIADRTASMQKLEGFVPLYWDERTGSLFMEVPRFDTEFLMATGLAAGLGSNDLGLDRGQESGGRVVMFQRVGPKVLLVRLLH